MCSNKETCLEALVHAAQAVAEERYDGHFTLMRFTTGWKAFFATPLHLGDPRTYAWLFVQPAHATAEEAIIFALAVLPESNGLSFGTDNETTRALLEAAKEKASRDMTVSGSRC